MLENMSIFLLTPASVGFLSLAILSAITTAYLLYISAKVLTGNNRNTTLLLAGTMAFLTLTIVLLFMEETFFYKWNIVALYFESLSLSIMLVFILQFAYHYPIYNKRIERESQIVLAVSILYSGLEIGIVVWRFQLFSTGFVSYRPEYADYPLALGLLWLTIIFIRQTVNESSKHTNASYLAHLLRPQGRSARATRSFLLLFIIGLLLGVFNIFAGILQISVGLNNGIVFIGLMLIIYFFTSLYINYFPETVSINLRLIGVSLSTNLVILGITAWVLFPATLNDDIYPETLISKQTFHYSPNTNQGYTVSHSEFRFQEETGTALHQNINEINLPFEFPFYGHPYSKIYLASYGVASFGGPVDIASLQYNYGPIPAIFALYYQINHNVSTNPLLDGGFTYNIDDEKVSVTWSLVAEEGKSDTRNVFQLVIYPDGSFDINIKDFNPRSEIIMNSKYRLAWFSGLSQGNLYGAHQILDSPPDFPFSGETDQAIILDYKHLLRSRQNTIFSTFIPLLFFSSFISILIYPLLLQNSFLIPVEALISGVKRVSMGDYSFTIATDYEDEIGMIAHTFNSMVSTLNKNMEDSTEIPSQKIASAMEQIPSSVMILNSEFNIEFVNPMFVKTTGYLAESVIGKSVDILKSGNTPVDVYRRLWRTIRKGDFWRGELLTKKKNGDEFWVFAVIAPVKNGEGQVSHYVWMMEDFTERKKTEEILKELSFTDPLTGVYNRRQLFSLGEKAFRQALRYNSQLCVLIMDVDHFKQINDTFGHHIGDRTLKALANTVNKKIRSADIFGRYGGEEFLLFAPNTTMDGAMILAEHVRSLVADLRISADDGIVQFTISIGVCEYSPSVDTLEKLISNADQALYDSKQAGRNKVTVFKEANEE